MPDIILRARREGDETLVRCLMAHPMHPDDFIQEVVCTWKDAVVLTAYWGVGVARNPYLSFRFRGGAAGDPVGIAWTDSQGRRQDAKAQIT